jgi:flagellar L-ring protein precursor FlgH
MRNLHLFIMLASLCLGGCNTMQEAKMSESFQSSYDNVVAVKEKAADGAIYSAAQTGFFSGDRRARNVGDVLTVNITETISATKSNDGSVTKKGSLAVGLPTALFGPVGVISGIFGGSKGGNAAFGATVDEAFAGSGAANQSNTITGTMTVMVTRVYANGNMWIEGQKLLSVSQGEEYVRVSGLVRPDDIGPGNTVVSNRIAQANITYTGAGDIADASKQGWYGRAFNALSPL